MEGQKNPPTNFARLDKWICHTADGKQICLSNLFQTDGKQMFFSEDASEWRRFSILTTVNDKGLIFGDIIAYGF